MNCIVAVQLLRIQFRPPLLSPSKENVLPCYVKDTEASLNTLDKTIFTKIQPFQALHESCLGAPGRKVVGKRHARGRAGICGL